MQTVAHQSTAAARKLLMNLLDKEKLLFAVEHILDNVDSSMLDHFIDHRWCVKDWEDLRDSLNATNPKEPKGPLDPLTIDVCMGCDDPPDPVGESHGRVDAWGDDFLQFARLISEAESCGMWGGPSSAIEELCNSMDLAADDVYEIVERAQRAFALMIKGI